MAKRSGETATTAAPTNGGPDALAHADEVQEVAARLRLAVARLHRALRQHADSGLSPSQLSALVAIERRGSMTLGELAAHEGVAPPTVTGVVARLEADGNVVRGPDAADGRIVRVMATDQGKELVVRARERKDAWLTRRVADLGPDDLDRLAEALAVIESLSERADP
jgi:DNA-binding MarR family transcriptional regulator